jgi:hypothetical protein
VANAGALLSRACRQFQGIQPWGTSSLRRRQIAKTQPATMFHSKLCGMRKHT